MTLRWKVIVAEFAHHLPYTIVGTLVAMAGVWWFGTQHLNAGHQEQLLAQADSSFHLFHPMHISLSAIATTSLFWRHDRHLMRAIAVGALGTIIPCGLSDYVFPYIGGRLMGQAMELHACIFSHPQLFFSFLALGILAGFWAEERLTGSHLFSHGAHIFVSSAASLLYLVSFGFTGWMTDVALVFPAFLTIVLAVWVPCCISDIVVPAGSAQLFNPGKPPAHPHAH
jgi:hypothetical protein